MRKWLFIVSLAVFSISRSQTLTEKNLVPNGSFENYSKKSSAVKSALPWVAIASVDYYQKPISNDTGRCKGAFDGDCYVGLRFQKKYKEAIEVKLAEPLKRGNNYQFECYIRLAFWSNAQLKSFGVYISKGGMKSVNFPEKEFVLDTIAPKGAVLHGGYCWFRFKGTYRAAGGEKYITIGNFSPNVRQDMAKMNALKPGFKEAYYFVDNVSLRWIKPADDVRTVYVDSLNYEKDSVLQVQKNVQAGEKIGLKIVFEQGKSYLLPESYSELNKLSQYLFRHPSFVIKINGHSDNSGSKNKNQRLSEERAKAVFEYLITHGVQNKMSYEGFGSSVPVADNNTEEGRIKNRRVEFEILKQ